MKKLFSLLSIMFLIFGFNLNVKADMGMPGVSEYNIRVKDVDGTPLYKFGGDENSAIMVPYDTILTVYMEETVNGVLYGHINYNDNSYVVDLSKIEIVKNEINLSEFKHDAQKMYVFKEGAYLYKGPSKVYGKVDGNVELPVGTIVSFEYYDELWAYVEYNGVKGWVYIYSYSETSPYGELSYLANMPDKKESLFTVSDVKLETYPGSNIHIGVTIPKFTDVDVKYLYKYGPHNHYYYVEYNGQCGWLYSGDYNIGDKSINLSVYALKDVNLLEDDKKTVIMTIPKNTEMKVIYDASFDDFGYVYVEYKGVKGWLFIDDGSYSGVALNYDNIYPKNKILVNAKLYDKIDGKLINKEIPANTIIEIKYFDFTNNWYYVVTKNYQGWINITPEDMEYIYIEDSEEEIINPEVAPEEETKTEEKEDVPELPKASPKEMAIYCISGAVVLALVAFVTIKLINKKKKTNTTEIVTDTENNNNE